MPARALVIRNPRSRGGVREGRWSAFEEQLRRRLGPVEVEATRGPRDAVRIAREGVRSGVELLVVAAGDGTLSEVVTGLLSAGLGGHARIGILPFGTGADFARALGVPRDPLDALEVLVDGKPRSIDAGRVDLMKPGGDPRTTWFANVASFGASARVVELVNSDSRLGTGSGAYLLGALRALAVHRSHPVRIVADGAEVYAGPLALAAVANGSFFGGGMRVAPEARLDDGLLDVVVVEGAGRVQLIAKLSKLYRGTHLADRLTHAARARVVELEPLGPATACEVDGDPQGVLPARVEALPAALTFLAPNP